jgi:hypothetical protein
VYPSICNWFSAVNTALPDHQWRWPTILQTQCLLYSILSCFLMVTISDVATSG